MPLYVETFVCRYEQIKEMQRFIQQKTLESASFNKDRDLVIVVGDFNQNASPMSSNEKRQYDLIRAEMRYRPILQLFHDPYRSMLCALKHAPSGTTNLSYTLIDCLRQS